MRKIIFICMGIICSIYSSNAQIVVECNDVEYIDGKKVMKISNERATVVIFFEDIGEFGKHFPFEIFIGNNGEKFTVDPAKIIIQSYHKKNATKECYALTSEEWWKITRRNIYWFGPDNVEEITTQVSTDSSSRSNGDYVSGTVNTTAKTTVYTGEKDKKMKEAKAEIDDNYLKKSTVYPKESISGSLRGGNTKALNLKIKIPISNQIFEFDLSKQ